MAGEKWVVVDEVPGSVQGEILSGLLKAQGIPAITSQEGAGRFGYPTNIGELGKVQILVPGSFAAQARQVLEDYYAGAFEAHEEEDD